MNTFVDRTKHNFCLMLYRHSTLFRYSCVYLKGVEPNLFFSAEADASPLLQNVSKVSHRTEEVLNFKFLLLT